MSRDVAKHPADVVALTTRLVEDIRAKEANKTAKVFARVTAFALGEKHNGHKVDMTSLELKAAEIHLKKTCPDLSTMIIAEAGDGYDNLSREDLAELAAGMLVNNPMLAKMTGIQRAIDIQNMVADSKPVEDIIDAEVIPFDDT